MNRTKQAGQARTFIVFGFLIFVSAAASTLLPGYGAYLALVLVVFGGFLMSIGAMIREHSRARESTLAEEDRELQTIEEQL